MGSRRVVVGNYDCNNHCIFCQFRNVRSRSYSLDTEQYKRKIDDIFRKKSTEIVFSGGEFLLRKDALDIVKYTREKGFDRIIVATNGIAISYIEYLEKLVGAGVDSFIVTLNSHKASLHDFITENKGSFDKVIKAIDNLQELKIDYTVRTIIIEQNYRYLYRFGEFLFKKKIEKAEFLFVRPLGNCQEKFKALVPKISDTIPYLKRAIEFSRQHFLKDWKVIGIPNCLLRGYDDIIVNEDECHLEDNVEFTKNRIATCDDCYYKSECSGVWQGYLDAYGESELLPIKEKPERKKCLLIRPPLYEPILNLLEIFNPLHKGISMRYMQASGLLKISSYLKATGNTVHMIDSLSTLDMGKKGLEKYVATKKLVKEVKGGNYDAEGVSLPQYHFGYSYDKIRKEIERLSKNTRFDEIYISTSMTYYHEAVHEVVKICKELLPNVKISLGGIYATLCPEHAKKSGADEVNIGEFCGATDMPTDLSVLSYVPSYAIIKSTHGCPNNCSYCAVSILEGRKMRYRNLDGVMNDILEKYNVYDIRDFVFFESNLLVNMEKHFLILLDKIIESGIKINLHCPEGFEVSKVTKEVAEKMYAAGFRKINLALETVDDDMLKRFHKGNTISNFSTAVEHLKNAGIKNVRVFLLVGLPDQSIESILKSYAYVWKHNCKLTFMPFTPIPKTIEYEKYSDRFSDRGLEELHPILLSCTGKNLTLEEAYQLAIFQDSSSPVEPWPVIYYLIAIFNKSRVIDLIIKYYYDNDRESVMRDYNNHKNSIEDDVAIKKAKEFFSKFKR